MGLTETTSRVALTVVLATEAGLLFVAAKRVLLFDRLPVLPTYRGPMQGSDARFRGRYDRVGNQETANSLPRG